MGAHASRTVWALEQQDRTSIPAKIITIPLTSIQQLREKLSRLGKELEPTIFVVSPFGDRLSIAVKEPCAAIVFTPYESKRPAMSASLDPTFAASKDEDYVEFVVGDTPTPLPKDRCLPIETMIRIAEHFFQHGTLPDWVQWVVD